MIYLDDASTTKPSELVLNKYLELLNNFFANPNSLHKLGYEINKLQVEARVRIATALGVNEKEIIFTSGASESNNMVLKGFLHTKRKHIISTNAEHPSVSTTLEQLEKVFNYQVDLLKVNSNGIINPEDLKALLNKETVLVSIIYINNEVGSINNIKEIREIINQFNKDFSAKVYLHIDATQAINKINLDLFLVDFASISFHKINGLKGSGILYKKKGIMITPLITGGSQEENLRAGTSNVLVNIANSYTLKSKLAIKENLEVVTKLNYYLREKLLAIKEVQINSPFNASPYILNISISNNNGTIIANALSNKNIYLSPTATCSLNKISYSTTVLAMFQDLKRASEVIRISLSPSILVEDIDIFIIELKRIISEVRK